MPAPVASVNPATLRTALGSFASSVTVLTTRDATGRSLGMTATAFSSLSIEARTILVCVNRDTRTHAAITRRGRFGVNVLASANRAVAEHCARPRADKGLDPEWLDFWPAWHSPALRGAVAFLDCKVKQEIEADTHSIIIGRITGLGLAESDPADPLLYFQGAFRELRASLVPAI